MLNLDVSTPAASDKTSRYSELELSTDEQGVLREALSDGRFVESDFDDQDGLVATAAKVAEEYRPRLPLLSGQVSRLLGPSPSLGLLVVKSLPAASDSRRVIALLGALLGKVDKFPNEGNYLIPIREQRTLPGERPSFKNSREFFLHIDLSYAPRPPEFFVMHSIVNNAGEGGLSTFCDALASLDMLSTRDCEELQQPNYLFPPPCHYKSTDHIRQPIATRDDSGGWQIRFRRDNLRAATRPGIEALIALIRALNRATFETMLASSSIAFINNRTFLHGRTAFVPSGNVLAPRHLNRAYVTPY